MKNEDKEAYAIYENTILQREGYLYVAREAWQAACDYKQKEIDDLEAENAKLKHFLKEIANQDYRGNISNESVKAFLCLKEIDEKL